MDYILENAGAITDAVSTQVWSGDAAVHVSIVNWTKNRLPTVTRLTFQRGDSVQSPWETFELPRINAALSVGVDVSGAMPLATNRDSKSVFVGQYPFHKGFMLDLAEAQEWIKSDPKLCEVLFPYMIGRDLVELGHPSRWIIDFGQNDVFYARSYPRAFARVEERVMPDVVARAEREKKETGKAITRWTRVAARWWQFRDYQPGTIAAIKRVPRYVAVSRVTKRPIFEFISSRIHPDNALVIFPLADDYSSASSKAEFTLTGSKHDARR